jgi:DNA-binding winged helix-turn-helix (wHTH) protein
LFISGPRPPTFSAALLERRGQLLERAELIQKVWKDTIVEEGNLSYTVSELRKVLGKNREGEHFIQTIPRRGYRFADNPPPLEEIELIYERQTQTVVEEIHISNSPASAAIPQRHPFDRTTIAVIALVVVTAITVGLMKWYGKWDAAGGAGVKSLAVVPFRTIEGDESTHRGLGLADVIITRLRGQKDITVRPTNAVMDLEDRDLICPR